MDPQLPLILMAGVLVVGVATQGLAHRCYRRCRRLPSRAGLSAGALARALLDEQGLLHVLVLPTERALDDRYDPRQKRLYLSDPEDTSLAGAAIAAHEVAHALQHEERHWSLALRRLVRPWGLPGAAVSLAGVVLGWWLQERTLLAGAAWGYVAVVVLMLLNLPVELNANRRALALLERGYLTRPQEWQMARQVLRAAVWTYVGLAALPLMHGLTLWSERRS